MQIITYTGSGLSFRITGDTLFFWGNVSTDPKDTVSRANFGVADTGVPFNYDPVTSVFGTKSQLSVNGVIRAASSSDIGSSGRIEEPEQGPGPPTVSIFRVLQAIRSCGWPPVFARIPPGPEYRIVGGNPATRCWPVSMVSCSSTRTALAAPSSIVFGLSEPLPCLLSARSSSDQSLWPVAPVVR